MDKDQKEYSGKVLGKGVILVKDQRSPDPFIVFTPLVKLEKNVPDREVLERLSQRLSDIYHPSDVYVVREAIRKYQGRPTKVSGFPVLTEAKTEGTVYSKSSTDRLDPEAEAVLNLHSLLPNLFDRSEQIFAKAGITSGSKKKRIKSMLLARSFWLEHKVQKGKGFVTLWEITPEAWVYQGKEPPKVPSKGGFLHQACAFYLAGWMKKKGWQCDIERPVGAGMKLVDAVVTNKDTGELIAIEFCTSTPLQKEVTNIVQDLADDTGISKVVVLTTDASMKRKLEGLIKEESELASLLDRISVHLIGEFID